MKEKHWLLGLLVVCVLGAHLVTPESVRLWHGVFTHLYFLPIALAGMWFGLWGGLAVALLGAGVYALEPTGKAAEALDFLLVGLFTGFIGGRELQSKAELRQALDQLGQTNEELSRSVEQIRRAERLSAVGELAAGMAHEIRNPIGSLKGAVGMLKGRQLSEERVQECLHIMGKECDRMSDLLTNLLDFARPRPLHIRSIELQPMLDSVGLLARAAAGAKTIEVEEWVEPGLSEVHCDSEQIRQVLLNLSLNAVQAMEKGGKLRLLAEREGRELVLRVVDEGCGIAEEDMGRIFDPFYTTKPEGTGLGLSVAYQIAEQHGGKLEAERNRVRGMTFVLRIPMERQGNEQG